MGAAQSAEAVIGKESEVRKSLAHPFKRRRKDGKVRETERQTYTGRWKLRQTDRTTTKPPHGQRERNQDRLIARKTQTEERTSRHTSRNTNRLKNQMPAFQIETKGAR